MSENRYPCPECGAVLKPKQAVPPGKKMRCPKCEAVFVPVAVAAAAPAKGKSKATAGKTKEAITATPKAAAPAPPVDEDNDRGSYTVATDEDDQPGKKKKRPAGVEYGSLRDKFAKSARGPALAKTTIPANWVMFSGILACVGYIVLFCVGFWPLVFTKEWPTAGVVVLCIVVMAVAVFGFVWWGLVIQGMFKMATLESYTWSWVGSVMAMLGNLPGAVMVVIFCKGDYISIVISALTVLSYLIPPGRCMVVLSDPDVKAGFLEERPEY